MEAAHVSDDKTLTELNFVTAERGVSRLRISARSGSAAWQRRRGPRGGGIVEDRGRTVSGARRGRPERFVNSIARSWSPFGRSGRLSARC